MTVFNQNQNKFLNFLGIEDTNSPDYISYSNEYEFTFGSPETITSDVPFETIRTILRDVYLHYRDGLGITQIENLVIFILFVRFIILAFRYNIKTSFYITCICFCSATIWYLQLTDIGMWYSRILTLNPITEKFGTDFVTYSATQKALTKGLQSDGPVRAFTRAITADDGYHRIDPISMLFSRLPTGIRTTTDKLYYIVFNDILSFFWKTAWPPFREAFPLIAWSVLTRRLRRYSPYMIRWYWTLGIVNDCAIYFWREFTIRGQNYLGYGNLQPLEENLLIAVIATGAALHFSYIIFGLIHAALGQYFYIPFLVENAELHVGRRPVDSIYSGGLTAWQDPYEKEQKKNRLIPKLWYGWFGRGSSPKSERYGTNERQEILQYYKKRRQKFWKRLQRTFGRFFNRS